MRDVPAWVTELPGFDVSGHWCAIICTDAGQHALEVLGLVFEHAEGRGRHYGGPGISTPRQVDADGNVYVPDVPPDAPPLRVPRSSLPGSITFDCPACDRTPRVPREKWSRIAESLELSGVFDVSRLDLSPHG